MGTVGIIAEFNPLHKGHEYLIREAKNLGTVIAVISGNFVQRGDTAIAEKRVRTKATLLAGADIVLELPVLWSMSTAQNFALGGVSALISAGCDTIMFGSEIGEISPLIETAEILCSNEFSLEVKKHLEKGVTFANARQSAAESLGAPKGILEGANNNLAIEYIIAAKKLGANVEFKTVKRRGAQHDSKELSEFVSASLLREKLLEKDKEFCSRYMSENILSLFDQGISDIKRIETSILSILRTRNLEELKLLPDISEGVENKLYFAIRQTTNLKDLCEQIKVKRYTLARIRRLVLGAYLGFDNSFFMKSLPYLRVLGFNSCGEKFLKDEIKNIKIPVILRAKEIETLPLNAKKVFEIERKATDLYSLSLEKPLPCGIEYTAKLIKMEC